MEIKYRNRTYTITYTNDGIKVAWRGYSVSGRSIEQGLKECHELIEETEGEE